MLFRMTTVDPVDFCSLGLLLLLVELLDRLDLLFELHPPILKPDLDLTFGQAQLVRHFDSPSSGEVVICMELLLQLQGLVPSVRLSASSPEAVRPRKKMRAT